METTIVLLELHLDSELVVIVVEVGVGLVSDWESEDHPARVGLGAGVAV